MSYVQDDAAAILDDVPPLRGTREDTLPEGLAGSLEEVASSGVAASTPPATTLGASDTGANGAPQPTPEARILTALYERGKLTAGDLGRARRLADDAGEPLIRMLVRLGLVSERDMAQAMSEVLDLPLADPALFPSEPVAEGLFSLRFLKDARVLPLAEEEDCIRVAVADAADPFVLHALADAAGKPAKAQVALPSDIESALTRLYEKPAEDQPDAEPELGDFDEEDIEHLKDLASEAPVIRLVNLLIQRAVESRASDIHIEPFDDELKVRYRVDGILQEVDAPPVRSTAAIISRVKIMAKLNIAERRLPQDGRIPHPRPGQGARSARLDRPHPVRRERGDAPAGQGERELRFRRPGLRRRRHGSACSPILEQPYGIILVTGPTGSGKSTTLYTALSRLNTQERKIITVEDPVEYQLPGINQIQVKPTDRPDLRRRPARHRAPGPGHHHGR